MEDWKALVTEDVFDDINKFENLRKNPNAATMPNRRHTMTIADMKSISNNIKSLNIFSGFGIGGGSSNSNAKTNIKHENNTSAMNAGINNQSKVSDCLKLARSRLQSHIYFKSGPGYDDFGFVSTQELIKVKHT